MVKKIKSLSCHVQEGEVAPLALTVTMRLEDGETVRVDGRKFPFPIDVWYRLGHANGYYISDLNGVRWSAGPLSVTR